MTRSRWTTISILAAALLVAACGGNGATATPGGTSPAATPGTASDAPGTEGTGGIGISGAVARLESLSSYRFSISMTAEGAAGFALVPRDGSMTIRGTVILKPGIAMDMTMTTKDKTGSETAFGYRIIGDKAYVRLGPDLWMETDADDAQSTVDSFKPGNFMTGFGSVNDMQNAGDEDRNGMATTHYQGEAPAAVGSMFGLPTGTWTMEAWIARDGGYLVSSSVSGDAPDGGFTMSVDISDLDSSDNKVEVPEKFTPLGG